MGKKFIVIFILILLVIFGIIFFRGRSDKYDYKLLTVSEYKYYTILDDGKYGVSSKDGAVIIEPIYESAIVVNADRAVFILNDGSGNRVVNDKNEEIFSSDMKVSAVEGRNSVDEKIYNNTVLKYEEDGKFGLIDFSGKKVTKAIYEEIASLDDKYGEILVKKNEKYGVISVEGDVLVKAKYDYIKGDGYHVNDSYKDGGYVVGEETGTGLAFGYLSHEGKLLVKMENESLYRVTEIVSDDVYVVASSNGRYAIYDNKKNMTGYKYISVFYNNGCDAFTVQKNKSYGLVDLNGENIINEEYDELMVVGIFVKASKNGENYTFNLSGDLMTNLNFVSLQETTTGKYYISIDDDYKYGVADKDQNVVIENKYDYIDEVETSGLLIAHLGTDITVYSGSGKEIVSAERAEVSFVGNYIKIDTPSESYYLTVDGKKVDNKSVYVENIIFADENSGKWGFVDLNGNVVIDYIYDEVTEVNEYGFAGVCKDGLWGSIDKNGNDVLEPSYRIDYIKPVFIGKYYLRNGILYGRN